MTDYTAHQQSFGKGHVRVLSANEAVLAKIQKDAEQKALDGALWVSTDDLRVIQHDEDMGLVKVIISDRAVKGGG